jgi:glycosyltransferase involved in cell wall biosynthesis
MRLEDLAGHPLYWTALCTIDPKSTRMDTSVGVTERPKVYARSRMLGTSTQVDDTAPRAGVNRDELAKKVNLLIVSSGLGFGGAETVVRDLAYSIDRRRFNVSVCSLKHLGPVGEELARSGIDITALADSYESSVDYLTFLKLRRVIKDKRVDIVHTHTTHGLVDASVCKLIKPSLKVVHTFHFGNYPHIRPKIRWMEQAFSIFPDQLVAVGDVQRQQVKAFYHLRDRHITTVRNGVRLVPTAGEAAFRARVGAEDCLLVGTVATFIEQKGLRDLLSVARRFRDTGRRAKFVIVGDGHLRPELERLRAEYGLEDVVVMPGWVKDAATVCVPTFDIYLQPSLWEAMSIAILEAMAAGRPVVATRVGEAPHVITPGVDGYLVDVGDIEGMAAMLSALADDQDLRRNIGTTAARTVEQRFTMDHMARAYEAMYLETLKLPTSA